MLLLKNMPNKMGGEKEKVFEIYRSGKGYEAISRDSTKPQWEALSPNGDNPPTKIPPKVYGRIIQ